MAHLFSKTSLRQRLEAVFTEHAALADAVGAVALPDDLKTWLTRLTLLAGVPINYIVPDEGMLPPESIRFFYLDPNWINVLIDGAFSIGRNLTPDKSSLSERMDSVLLPKSRPQVQLNARALRAKAFGLKAEQADGRVISGFLLRSSVVTGYKGIGVNAYPQGQTPSDPTITILPILRFEQLGPGADTILCLLDGDAYQVDIHEPPEGLHYGVDSYSYDGTKVTAIKMIHTFTRDGSNVTMSPDATPLQNFQTAFRSSDPRTLMMSTVASMIGAANQPVQTITSAEMGFEMNQGVGQVSFVRGSSK